MLVIAAICTRASPAVVFELGTYTGISTLIMALNTPADTKLLTIDLDPATRDTHRHGQGVGGLGDYSVGIACHGTTQSTKITQLYGNSITFDYTQFHGAVDLVLVDADHTYDFVKTDSATAFKLLRPGGIIIWDDYIWTERFPECAGVTRCLNELSITRSIYQLQGTRLAIYIDRP